MRIAHIVNPVHAGPTSDLLIAQPITFESMRLAADYAAPSVNVELLSASFVEDRIVVPSFFRSTRDLDRSSSDLGTFAVPRKLPLLGDILERLGEAAPQADIYIYTNVDIAVVPHFYVSVAALAQQTDALIINRRTLPAHLNTIDQLPLMYAEIGKRHPGLDCFVFRSELLDRFELGNSLIGVPWIGQAMLCNLVVHADSFALLADLHLTFHIGDDRAWRQPELDDYRNHNKRELSQVLTSWSESGLLDSNPLARETLDRMRQPEAGWVRKRKTSVRRFLKAHLPKTLLSLNRSLRHGR